MTSVLPGSAAVPAPAALPPSGLTGMDSRFSRLVTVPKAKHTWHLLDNASALKDAGIEPIGTILCVHGNPTWSFLWRALVSEASGQALAGGDAWRVIAVDQLEMGFSERTGTLRRLADRVTDLGELTDHLGLAGPVVTLGHDWGGVVSLGWAIEHRAELAGVMLLNTAVHQPENDPIPAPLRLALRPGVLGAATVTTPGFLETTLRLAHPCLSPQVRDGFRAPYVGAQRRGGIGGFVADIPVDEQHPSWAELERIASGVTELGAAKTPALMLWGPKDPIFSDRYLQDLLERVPEADVHRFEGAGHLLAEDVDYSSAVLAWLSRRIPQVGELSDPVLPPGAESGPTPGSTPGVSPEPMWHQLEALQDSSAAALVEMAPGQGAGPRVVSWRLLAQRVEEIAAGLRRIGVGHGDRVSLLIQPGADLTAVLYACLRIGAIVVVADAGLGLAGLTRAVRGARPKHIIGELPGLTAARALNWPGQKISTTPLATPLARALGVSTSLADVVDLGADRELPAPPTGSDHAAILFTSGSTGPAKGVVYTHDQLCAMRDVLAVQYGIGVATGLVAGFAPFALLGPALGARSVTPDMDVTSPRTLSAGAVAAAVAAAHATIVFLSPAAVENVVATRGELTARDDAALAQVELFLSAGAPVSEHLLSQVNALMPNASAHTPYGMTEGLLVTDICLEDIRSASASLSQTLPDGDTGPGDDPGGVCVGLPTASAQVRISALDRVGHPTGSPCSDPGVTGEILVSAPHVKDHYDRLWLTELLSRAVPGQNASGHQWHRTGDVGHVDPAGRLWIEGRLAHVITTPSGVVTPVGIEQRIEQVPTVLRSAVVGVGPCGTQQVVAVVEPRARTRRVRLAEADLAASVRAAARVDIAAVLVVPSMPTDIRHNSKIDRTHLATWAERILSGGRMGRP